MIAATNKMGHFVQRFDGIVVGLTAITEPGTRDAALRQFADLARTPGAEYRIYSALETRS